MIPSPPSSQTSPPINGISDVPPDPLNHTFYMSLPLPDHIPSVSLAIGPLAFALNTYLGYLQTVCKACYFLRASRPIQVVLTHPRGGRWDEVDYHRALPLALPLHPSTPYKDFSHEAHRSLRGSRSGGDGWSVCTICGEPWDITDLHERCVFGDSIFMPAFMVWEDRPTRDHVFSFIQAKTALDFPNLPTRSHYADWLGCSISPSLPTLNNIHALAIAYRTLRHTRQVPQ